MSIKAKLLEKVSKNAKKIREKRIVASHNKTVEAAVFEFFRNIEEALKLGISGYDPYLFNEAKISLEKRLKAFDRDAKISVQFTVSEDLTAWESTTVRGVTIWWGQFYIAKNNVEPSLYIDVSQMLFN